MSTRPAPSPHTLAEVRHALALLQTTTPNRTEPPMGSTNQPHATTPVPLSKTRAQVTAEARSRVAARRAAEEDALYRQYYPNPND